MTDIRKTFTMKTIPTFLLSVVTYFISLGLGISKNYQQWSWRFINEEKWLKTFIADLK